MQRGTPCFLPEEDEIMLYALIKTVVDEVWFDYNKTKSQTIGKKQLNAFLRDKLEVPHVGPEEFEAIFARTSFNDDCEMDQFEMCVLILRMSSLTSLISEEKIKSRMGYEQVYPRKVKRQNHLRINVARWLAPKIREDY